MCVIIKRDELPYNLERKKKKNFFGGNFFYFPPIYLDTKGENRKEKRKEGRHILCFKGLAYAPKPSYINEPLQIEKKKSKKKKNPKNFLLVFPPFFSLAVVHGEILSGNHSPNPNSNRRLQSSLCLITALWRPLKF